MFHLTKTLLLVEGIADKVCIEKFAEILNVNLENWYIIPCNGSPIFDVTYVCIMRHIKFRALFDRDNLKKPEVWMNKQYGYKEYLEIFQKNKNCIFTPQLRTERSLEDCFHEEDQEKYFDYYSNQNINRKISAGKIREASVFHIETLNNFELLFKEIGLLPLDKNR